MFEGADQLLCAYRVVLGEGHPFGCNIDYEWMIACRRLDVYFIITNLFKQIL